MFDYELFVIFVVALSLILLWFLNMDGMKFYVANLMYRFLCVELDI